MSALVHITELRRIKKSKLNSENKWFLLAGIEE